MTTLGLSKPLPPPPPPPRAAAPTMMKGVGVGVSGPWGSRIPPSSGGAAGSNVGGPLAPVMQELSQVFQPFPDSAALAQQRALTRDLTAATRRMAASPKNDAHRTSPWANNSQSRATAPSQPREWLRFVEPKSGSVLYLNTRTNYAQGERPADFHGSDDEAEEEEDDDDAEEDDDDDDDDDEGRPASVAPTPLNLSSPRRRPLLGDSWAKGAGSRSPQGSSGLSLSGIDPRLLGGFANGSPSLVHPRMGANNASSGGLFLRRQPVRAPPSTGSPRSRRITPVPVPRRHSRLQRMHAAVAASTARHSASSHLSSSASSPTPVAFLSPVSPPAVSTLSTDCDEEPFSAYQRGAVRWSESSTRTSVSVLSHLSHMDDIRQSRTESAALVCGSRAESALIDDRRSRTESAFPEVDEDCVSELLPPPPPPPMELEHEVYIDRRRGLGLDESVKPRAARSETDVLLEKHADAIITAVVASEPKLSLRRTRVVRADLDDPLASTQLGPSYINNLAAVEVQSIMQCLDATSLLRLARCNRRMLRDASADIAWSTQPPFAVAFDASEVDLGARIRASLVARAPGVAVVWRRATNIEDDSKEGEVAVDNTTVGGRRGETRTSEPGAARGGMEGVPSPANSTASAGSTSVSDASEETADEEVDALLEIPRIVELQEHRGHIRSAHWHRIFAAPALVDLVRLKVDHAGESSQLPTGFAGALAKLPRLGLLDIVGELPPGDPLAALAELPCLTALGLNDGHAPGPPGEDGQIPPPPPSVLSAVAECTHLTQLWLRLPRLPGAQFRAFFTAPSLSGLELLQLLLFDAACPIDPVPAADYAASFSALPALRRLSLIAVLRVDALLAGVSSAARLAYLEIESKVRDDAGVRTIPSVEALRVLLRSAQTLRVTLRTCQTPTFMRQFDQLRELDGDRFTCEGMGEAQS